MRHLQLEIGSHLGNVRGMRRQWMGMSRTFGYMLQEETTQYHEEVTLNGN